MTAVNRRYHLPGTLQACSAARHGSHRAVWLALASILFVALPGTQAAENENAASSEKRLSDATQFLADDQLEGRGVGTAGIDKAADYIAAQFAALGLNTQLYDGTPFQKFKMNVGVELGEPNQLTLVPAAGDKDKPIEWKSGEQFIPLSLGGAGKLDVPLVFAGYGITGKDENYDDYAGINVEGKAVIILRHEPQQKNPHSVFNGTQNSALAPLWRKVSNAYEHGAAAVIFCTDEVEIRNAIGQRRKLLDEAFEAVDKAHRDFAKLEQPSLAQVREYQAQLTELTQKLTDQIGKFGQALDPLMKFQVPGGGEGSRMPVVQCQRAAIDALLKTALDTDLSTLEREIDEGPTPHSREIPGWKLQGEINVHRREADVKNVVAVLEGEGPYADETIVVGAHYDHLGMGDEGSFVRGSKEIHNGADDNGSGTAALIEVAHQIVARGKKLPRRVVFIAFTGEERGLIGSARYCKEPLYPLDKTVAMLNMDMVGRLKDEKLIIQGLDTAAEFDPLLDRLMDGRGFDLSKKSGGTGPSDHSSFYPHKIPVMHFFTGLHTDYHRPSDDHDKLNVPGIRRVAELVADVTIALAEGDARPTFVEKAAAPTSRGAGEGGERPYFGSIPDFGQDQPGYALSGATKDSPADKAGLKSGDIIIKFGESRIGNLEDFDSALRKFKGGDKVPVVVKRGAEEVTLEVTLGAPK